MTTTTERRCEQQCGAPATVYGGGPKAGDWAGWYCEPCIKALKFRIWDRVTPEQTEAEAQQILLDMHDTIGITADEADEQYDGRDA